MQAAETPAFGTLVVVIDRARNLPNRKKIGKQDVYTIVRLGHEVQKTPTDKRAGQVPAWNHEVRFKVPNESENMLKISVFNENSKTPDLIGDCSVDLSALYKKHEFDSWFDLRYKDKPAGEIYAELTFYYTGPPKPKPKIVLANIPQRLSNGNPLPAVSPADLKEDRRRSMPVTQHSHGLPYDPAAALSTLTLDEYSSRNNRDYEPSPYQAGVKYAETWDGKRDNRVIVPAPGDIRRKSFSADRPAAGPIPYRREHTYEEPVQRARSVQPPPRSNTYDDRRRSPLREEPVYADPVLDPRHGSPFELRNSARIVSPLPEHPDRYQRRSPLHYERRYSPEHDIHRGHAQAHSYSQPQRYHEPAHNKSASTTYIHQPVNLDSLRYQVPDTYAPTPAQYQSAHRPLPMAPHDPPPRPLKIPLNLTQQEYDILYRR